MTKGEIQSVQDKNQDTIAKLADIISSLETENKRLEVKKNKLK